MKPDILPNKLTDLLTLALNDLEKCYKDPKFLIDYGQWYTPRGKDRPCFVCLAGSVMAKTLKIKSDKELTPESLHPELSGKTIAKLQAIDCFRKGLVSKAMLTLTTRRPERDVSTPKEGVITFLNFEAYPHDRLGGIDANNHYTESFDQAVRFYRQKVKELKEKGY